MKEEKSILTPSRFGADGFQARSSLSAPVLLRPSVLSDQTSRISSPSRPQTDGDRTSFSLKPPVLSNPFGASLVRGSSASAAESKVSSPPVTPAAESPATPPPAAEGEAGEGEPAAEPSESSDKDAEPPVVKDAEAPATTTTTTSTIRSASTPTTLSALTEQSDAFVFGENIRERVVNMPAGGAEHKNGVSEAADTQDMLFSSAVQQNKPDEQNGDGSKSLSESAREYEVRLNKRKYEQVENLDEDVTTGEEDESNVLQMSCKLFLFDSVPGTWKELGRGILRLNDMDTEDCTSGQLQSRMVVRTAGTHRVVLNTKIFSGMMVNRASDKSIRLSAIDGDAAKIFLISSGVSETERLYSALYSRVSAMPSPPPPHHSPSSSPTPPSSQGGDSSLDAATTSSTPSPPPTAKRVRHTPPEKGGESTDTLD